MLTVSVFVGGKRFGVFMEAETDEGQWRVRSLRSGVYAQFAGSVPVFCKCEIGFKRL